MREFRSRKRGYLKEKKNVRMILKKHKEPSFLFLHNLGKVNNKKSTSNQQQRWGIRKKRRVKRKSVILSYLLQKRSFGESGKMHAIHAFVLRYKPQPFVMFPVLWFLCFGKKQYLVLPVSSFPCSTLLLRSSLSLSLSLDHGQRKSPQREHRVPQGKQ